MISFYSLPARSPLSRSCPGVGQVFTLRTVEDTLRIHEFVKTHHPRSVVLAGGGFISLEMAENLRELGMEVTMVQRPKQLMNPFEPGDGILHSRKNAEKRRPSAAGPYCGRL